MSARRLLVVLCAALCFAAGCATTYPGTGSLWVGMTREQAIRAMGPPESVSAQGSFEYLNYTLSVASGGYTVGRPYIIRIVDGAVESYGYSGQFAAGAAPRSGTPGTAGAAAPGAPAAAAKNQIRVLSVEPSRLKLGVTNHVKLKLAYALPQLPQGMISVSLNTKTPGMHLTLATRTVTQGSGDVDVSLDVVPVDWAQRSDVKMLVSLYPIPAGGASSLDFVRWDFAVAR